MIPNSGIATNRPIETNTAPISSGRLQLSDEQAKAIVQLLVATLLEELLPQANNIASQQTRLIDNNIGAVPAQAQAAPRFGNEAEAATPTINPTIVPQRTEGDALADALSTQGPIDPIDIVARSAD